MKKAVFFAIAIFGLVMTGISQTEKAPAKPVAKVITGGVDLSALSKAAFEAHGGEKLKKIKTLVFRGSVDVTTSAFPQAIPGTYSTVIDGDKYVLDIQTSFQSIKQVFDGKTTTSSIGGITLPPVTTLGFPMLPRLGDAGYAVSALPESKKKIKGFRMTSPDGFYTDFYLDEKTNLIKGYESAYEFGERSVTTSVEIDKYRVVDGITIPEKYAQRFDLGQVTAYSNFKTKEILVNSEIDAAYFTAGK